MSDSRRTLLKLAIFLAPFVAWWGMPIIALWWSRELAPLETIVTEQQVVRRTDLVGLAFTNPARTYKLRCAQTRGARTLILGTSRVMQLRPAWFRDPEATYNAGGGVDMLWQWRVFLDALPENRRPRLLIAGLDQWEFNPAWAVDSFGGRASAYEQRQDPLGVLQDGWRRVYREQAAGNLPWSRLLGNWWHGNSIGLAAVANRQGFRRDGSYRAPESVTRSTTEQRLSEAHERMGNGGWRFERATTIDPTRLAILRELIDDCQTRGIHVAAFLPPYAHQVWEEISRDDGYRYLRSVPHEVGDILAAAGGTLLDCSDIRAIASDEEIYDGYHGSEVAYLRLLIALAEHDEQVRAAVDLDNLRQRLAATTGPYFVSSD